MKDESAVQFETVSHIHMGLAVNDLEKSLAFYRILFGQESPLMCFGKLRFTMRDVART